MKRRGFTLIEIVISLMIMATMSGIFMLNVSMVDKQTADKEAQKVVAYINHNLRKADLRVTRAKFDIKTNAIDVDLSGDVQPTFEASKGCTYTTAQLCYNYKAGFGLYSAIKSESMASTSKMEDESDSDYHIITITDSRGESSSVYIRKP